MRDNCTEKSTVTPRIKGAVFPRRLVRLKKMFEAKLSSSGTLKRIVDALRELLTEATFDCSAEGIRLDAMDSSHVCLVSLFLKPEGFQMYNCPRSFTMGVQFASLSKIFKCSENTDIATIRADENQDSVTFIFESTSQSRVAEYEMKLMNLQHEHFL